MDKAGIEKEWIDVKCQPYSGASGILEDWKSHEGSSSVYQMSL